MYDAEMLIQAIQIAFKRALKVNIYEIEYKLGVE